MGVGILMGRDTLRVKNIEKKIPTLVTHTENTSVGNPSKGVYVDKQGNVLPMTYTLGKDVPHDAKFSDTVYIHPEESGFKHIPSGGASGQILKYGADGTAVWANNRDTVSSIKVTNEGNTIRYNYTDGTYEILTKDSENKYTLVYYDTDDSVISTTVTEADNNGNITVNRN